MRSRNYTGRKRVWMECSLYYHLLEGYAMCPVHLFFLSTGQEVLIEILLQSWMCGRWWIWTIHIWMWEKYTLSSLSHCVWRFWLQQLKLYPKGTVMMIVFDILLASNCQYWWGTPISSVRFASNIPFTLSFFFFLREGIKVILVSWNEFGSSYLIFHF